MEDSRQDARQYAGPLGLFYYLDLIRPKRIEKGCTLYLLGCTKNLLCLVGIIKEVVSSKVKHRKWVAGFTMVTPQGEN